jgi:glycosyltransferase involved in cell wall biosynthesis
MKVKVLEGLYRGVPTVSTSVGAEGILVEDQKHIMIADQAEDFAQKCSLLLSNESKWNLLRDESRKLAAKKYRWQPLFERMDKELQALL